MEIIDNLEDEAAEVQKPEGMPPLRPDEPVPEEDFSMEDSVVVLDEIYPPEMPAPPKKRIRPEWILAAIALLAAAALAWVAILCRPYYKAADDPEALVVRRHHEEMTEPPVSPEPETEPEDFLPPRSWPIWERTPREASFWSLTECFPTTYPIQKTKKLWKPYPKLS